MGSALRLTRCVIGSSPTRGTDHFGFSPVLRDWVIKGLGMYSRVYATGHITDPVPLIGRRRGLSPGGRFPPSFIHQVIIITGLNKLWLYALALKMASDADWALNPHSNSKLYPTNPLDPPDPHLWQPVMTCPEGLEAFSISTRGGDQGGFDPDPPPPTRTGSICHLSCPLGHSPGVSILPMT